MPAKIAFVLHESPARRMAGVEIYVLHLARAFAEAGYDVECVHPWPNSGRPLGEVRTELIDGVPFTAFPVPIKPDLAARFMDEEIGGALASYLKGRGVDMVHVHHLIGFTGSAIPAMKAIGLPVAMTIHDAWFCCNQCHFVRWDGAVCMDGPPGPDICAACLLGRVPGLASVYDHELVTKIMALRSRYLVAALAQADTLLANSWYTRENLLREGLLEDRILLSPLGVPGFKPQPRSKSDGALRLGYLGNISPKKGLDVVLEAFGSLEPGRVELSVHGAARQDAYHQSLMPLLDAPGVFQHGPYDRAELPRILANLDAVVVPSREESYSLVVREAFMAGVPVIASRIPALEEAVDDGLNGLLFTPGDSQALAGLLEELLEEPGLLDSMGERIPPVRTIEDDRDKLLKLYDSLMHG